MSVLKSERNTSTIQYLDTARKLEIHTIRQCLKLPKRYTFAITNRLIDIAGDIYDEVTHANSIYPTTLKEYNARRSHLTRAECLLNSLDHQLSILADLLSDSESLEKWEFAFREWGNLINSERKYVVGVKKSDRERYRRNEFN